jgi:tetratricopeptide (TPR) repeat protein
VIFCLALAVRGAVWDQLRTDVQFNALVGDPAKYDAWARDITAGDWLSRREGVFYQAPLYPYFLAAHYAMFGDGSVNAVRVTQLLIGSGAAVMLAMAAWRLAGPIAGVIAGTLLALQPSAVFFDVQIEKASLDGALMSLILLLVARLIDRPRWLDCALAGATLGVMSLSRENAMALLAVILPLAWRAGRTVTRQPVRIEHWLFPLISLTAFALVLLPVTVRNRVIGGEWHLTTSQFGPNFYIGNGRPADGVYRPLRPGRGDARFERTDATELAENATGRTLSPRQVSRYWTARTLTEIADDPGRWLGRMVRKWILLFHRVEIADNNDLDSAAVASSLLGILYATLHFGVITALAAGAAASALLRRAHGRTLWSLLAIVLVMSASAALFYVFARYRFTLLHPLALIAAIGVVPTRRDAAGEANRGFDWLPIAAGVVTAGSVLWICTSSILLPLRVRGADLYNRALAYERRGDTVPAEAMYRRAIGINPLLVEARNNLGLLLAQSGRFDEAIEQYNTVLLHHPRDAFALNNLGMAYGGKGDLARAIECFERALRLDPHLSQARINLEQAHRILQRP